MIRACFFRAIVALPALALLLSAPPARADDAAVVEAALTTYVHGMTTEIAATTVGAEGVPTLVRLLSDPGLPRRDNVVAFLTYLGGDEQVDALVAFLADPPASLDVAEEDRAALLVPEALGRIAGRGGDRALEVLLAMTADGSNGGVLGAAAAREARSLGDGASAPAGSLDDGAAVEAAASPGDASPDAQRITIDFANHVDHTDPIDEGRVGRGA